MSDGIAEMNRGKGRGVITYEVKGIVYEMVEGLGCHDCAFNTGGNSCAEAPDCVGHIYVPQSPLAKASADLAARGTPLVAGLQEINKDAIRTFDTGATRDSDEGKHDVEAFFSPLVTKRRAEFMHLNRKMDDGSMRDGDNWQLGHPYDESLKSLCRHVEDIKLLSRGYDAREDIETAICAAMFNLESMLLTRLEEKLK